MGKVLQFLGLLIINIIFCLAAPWFVPFLLGVIVIGIPLIAMNNIIQLGGEWWYGLPSFSFALLLLIYCGMMASGKIYKKPSGDYWCKGLFG